ncbi:hypothetical protein H696_02540 [Fonticula alba]|uniref:Uncharacterized protein n=1 Tax=Fonticula alba TaxID=691883 RepID=A0A058ZDQ5_FONAL|nr:hypothetical protein H696_02540 [Fonticula alba]KCV71597.1 hypothetical protein H696_02540 [Fonticula alba]|eukprot:XP_009494720.1 hypothetical protein H696_02540 [Fonticula alba]
MPAWSAPGTGAALSPGVELGEDPQAAAVPPGPEGDLSSGDPVTVGSAAVGVGSRRLPMRAAGASTGNGAVIQMGDRIDRVPLTAAPWSSLRGLRSRTQEPSFSSHLVPFASGTCATAPPES